MTEIERLRFYLRDPAGAEQFFTDDELAELLDYAGSFEAAVGMGWLVKGAATFSQSNAAGAVTSRTIGKITEQYASGGTTTNAQTAFTMAQFWFARAGVSVARWMEMVPAEGFIAETLNIVEAISTSTDHDLSRLVTVW